MLTAFNWPESALWNICLEVKNFTSQVIQGASVEFCTYLPFAKQGAVVGSSCGIFDWTHKVVPPQCSLCALWALPKRRGDSFQLSKNTVSTKPAKNTGCRKDLFCHIFYYPNMPLGKMNTGKPCIQCMACHFISTFPGENYLLQGQESFPKKAV